MVGSLGRICLMHLLLTMPRGRMYDSLGRICLLSRTGDNV